MIKKYCGYLSIIGLSFLSTNILLNAVLTKVSPEAIIRTYTVKIKEIEKNPNEYNTLFIGSSHIHYHLIPSQFDSFAHTEGFSARSFNMGSPTLDIMETHELVRRILSTKPANLKYVFIEPRAFNDHFQKPNSLRSVYFHNLQNTLFSLQYTLKSNLDFNEKTSKIRSTIQSFSFNFFNIGKLNDLARQTNNIDKLDTYSLGPAKDGFAEMKWYCSRIEGREGKACLKQIEAFRNRKDQSEGFHQSAKADYSKALENSKPFSKHQIQVFVDLSNYLKKHNITAIFVNTPAVYEEADKNMGFKTAYEQYKPPIHVLDYTNPDLFPELFHKDLWYDTTHLNQQGAQILTQHIASDFLIKIHRYSEQ